MFVKAIAFGALGALLLSGNAEAHTVQPIQIIAPFDNTQTIDMPTGARLHLRYTARTVPEPWASTWGSDASVEWATESCLDHGGIPRWRNGTRLTCRNVDF